MPLPVPAPVPRRVLVPVPVPVPLPEPEPVPLRWVPVVLPVPVPEVPVPDLLVPVLVPVPVPPLVVVLPRRLCVELECAARILAPCRPCDRVLERRTPLFVWVVLDVLPDPLLLVLEVLPEPLLLVLPLPEERVVPVPEPEPVPVPLPVPDCAKAAPVSVSARIPVHSSVPNRWVMMIDPLVVRLEPEAPMEADRWSVRAGARGVRAPGSPAGVRITRAQ